MLPTLMRFILGYKSSICILSLYFIFLLHPLVVVALNPPPAENALVTMNVKVIKAGNKYPNLTIVKDDGRVGYLDFPSPTYDLLRGFGAISVKDDDLSIIDRGCTAKIGVDRMRFLLFRTKIRVWSMECGSVSLTYSNMRSVYERTLHLGYWIAGLLHAFALAVCCLFIYSDRRKRWAFQ